MLSKTCNTNFNSKSKIPSSTVHNNSTQSGSIFYTKKIHLSNKHFFKADSNCLTAFSVSSIEKTSLLSRISI